MTNKAADPLRTQSCQEDGETERLGSAGVEPSTLGAAVEATLDELAAVGGEVARRHFRAAADDVGGFGEAIVAQHLRNRLLAYGSTRSFVRQAAAGLTLAMRGRLLALVELLEAALARALAPASRTDGRGPLDDGARVLILLDHLPSGGRIYSHTRQVCAYAAAIALDPAVAAVGVLASQETAPENPFDAVEVESVEDTGWRRELAEVGGEAGGKISFFTPARQGPVRPYRASLDWSDAFAADVVLAPQGVFRSRLLPRFLAPRAAMIALQMNATNPEPPWADLVLAHGHGGGQVERPRPAAWRAHPVPMLPFAPIARMPAEALGPAAALRVVTVLTQGRLERGLMKDGGADLEFVAAFLRQYPSAAWVMVGLDDPNAFAAEIAARIPKGVKGRLVLLGVVSDPAAVFAHCQIYMHPPALAGGAMGAAMAITANVPVLARSGGDISNLLPAGHAYGDAAQAGVRLRRLASDGDLRQRWLVAQQRTLARDHSLAAAGRALRPIIAEARAISRIRRAQALPGVEAD